MSNVYDLHFSLFRISWNVPTIYSTFSPIVACQLYPTAETIRSPDTCLVQCASKNLPTGTCHWQRSKNQDETKSESLLNWWHLSFSILNEFELSSNLTQCACSNLPHQLNIVLARLLFINRACSNIQLRYYFLLV